MTSLVQLCVVGDGRLLCRVFGEKMTSLVQLDLEEPRDPPCLCCGCVARPKVETERERDTHTHIHSWGVLFLIWCTHCTVVLLPGILLTTNLSLVWLDFGTHLGYYEVHVARASPVIWILLKRLQFLWWSLSLLFLRVTHFAFLFFLVTLSLLFLLVTLFAFLFLLVTLSLLFLLVTLFIFFSQRLKQFKTSRLFLLRYQPILYSNTVGVLLNQFEPEVSPIVVALYRIYLCMTLLEPKLLFSAPAPQRCLCPIVEYCVKCTANSVQSAHDLCTGGRDATRYKFRLVCQDLL